MKNFLRNLFAFLCVLAVIGAFLYTARPEWFRGVTASSRPGSDAVVTQKTVLTLPIPGAGQPTVNDGTDIRQLIDMEERGLPSKANPYIMVVNTRENTIRHYRLTTNVKAVALRSPAKEVVLKKSFTLNSESPIQLEVWIPNERELTFDVEYAIANRSP
jgi:hypothetical protein